jgi:predicted regulator of Ras-like GTPase activity (Roadblock/LC7/MglB family)
MTKLEQTLHEFRSELGGDFLSTEVVGMDGISIAGGSLDPDYDANEISARFAEVMKLAVKVSTKIDTGKVEDNLVTTDKTYILTRFLGNTDYFWVVIVTSGATLGSVRMLMNEYAPQIAEAIPHEISTTAAERKNSEAQSKENKSKRINFWADAHGKKGNDENNSDDAKKTFMIP